MAAKSEDAPPSQDDDSNHTYLSRGCYVDKSGERRGG